MRKIKFRGEYLNDTNKYEKVYGNLLTYKEPYRLFGELGEETACFIDTGTKVYKVLRTTVRQYTGCVDKNLVEIYDEDLLKAEGTDEMYVVSWENYGFVLQSLNTGKYYKLGGIEGLYVIDINDYFETHYSTSLQTLIGEVIRSNNKYRLFFRQNHFLDGTKKYGIEVLQGDRELYREGSHKLNDISEEALLAMNIETCRQPELPNFIKLLDICYAYKIETVLLINSKYERLGSFSLMLSDNNKLYKDLWIDESNNILISLEKEHTNLDLLENVAKECINQIESKLRK